MKIPKVQLTFRQGVLIGYCLLSVLLITCCLQSVDGGPRALLRIALCGVYLVGTVFLIFHDLTPPKKVTEERSNADQEGLSIEFLRDLMAISESGKTAWAKVLSVSEVGQYIDLHPFLKVHLQVNEKGKKPFSMEAYTLVNKRLIPRIGDRCRIRYLTHTQKTIWIVELGKLTTNKSTR